MCCDDEQVSPKVKKAQEAAKGLAPEVLKHLYDHHCSRAEAFYEAANLVMKYAHAQFEAEHDDTARFLRHWANELHEREYEERALQDAFRPPFCEDEDEGAEVVADAPPRNGDPSDDEAHYPEAFIGPDGDEGR